MRITNKTIVKDTSSSLRQKSIQVKTPLSKEDHTLLMDMLQYVKDSIDPEKAKTYDLRPAVGISAIQVGIAKQLIAISIRYNENEYFEYALANPKIISHSARYTYLKQGEGCLSVLDTHEGYVKRFAKIKVKAYDAIQKKDILLELEGFEAIVMQHEIDHLDGILFYDHIQKSNPFQPIENAVVIE